MKYCSNCGNQINDDAKFCCHCGADVQQQQSNDQKQEKKKLNVCSLISFICGIFSIKNVIKAFFIDFIVKVVGECFYVTTSNFAEFICALLAIASIVLGIIGIVQSKNEKGINKIFAIIGLCLGVFSLIGTFITGFIISFLGYYSI